MSVPQSITRNMNENILTRKSLGNNLSGVSYQVPDNITEIANYTFQGCSDLERVVIPDSVTRIGEGAFCDCEKLREIVLPNSLDELNGLVFFNCAALEAITIPNSVRRIGSCAFSGCERLKTILIPDVDKIESSAFYGCTSLESVVLPKTITEIPAFCFYHCKCLRNIDLPDSIISIEQWAFSGCDQLEQLTVPNTIRKIGNNAYEGTLLFMIKLLRFQSGICIFVEIIHNMKTATIFYAGPTKLIEERKQIKALANDVNAKNESKGIHLVVKTYEHLGDDQTVYNRFIASKTDFAIVVFKDTTKCITYRELEIALETIKRKNVAVFLHADNADPDDTERLINALGNEKYFYRYKNIDDLKYQVSDIYTKWFDKKFEEEKKNKFWRGITMSVLAIALAVLSLGIYKRSQEPMLLLAGGGSVANYLDSLNVKIDALNKRTICIRMGSEHAWSFLSEEANRKPAKGLKSWDYIPVCMSAEKAVEENFLTACNEQQLTERYAIVEYHLGKDPLVVYVDSSWYAKQAFGTTDNGKLSKEKFTELFKKAANSDTVKIFATSETSGTRRCYYNLLDTDTFLQRSIYSERVQKFHENKGVEKKDSVLLFLCSDYYRPKQHLLNMDSKPMIKRYIESESGELISKDLYLYFPAYRNSPSNDNCEIPSNVMKFLKRAGAEKDSQQWNSIGKGKFSISKGTIIYSPK